MQNMQKVLQHLFKLTKISPAEQELATWGAEMRISTLFLVKITILVKFTKMKGNA